MGRMALALGSLLGALASSDAGVELAGMPLCAHAMLAAGAQLGIERLPPEPGVPPQLSVDCAYVLHYRGNTHRLAVQRSQMPRLGVPVGLVVGYDAQDITDQMKQCIYHNQSVAEGAYNCQQAEHFTNASLAAMRLRPRSVFFCTADSFAMSMPEISATLKLHVALYDMIVRSYERVLVVEDDVQIDFSILPRLEASLNGSVKLPGLDNFTIIFGGAYASGRGALLDPVRWRSNEPHLKDPELRHYGIMPAVGEVISSRGAVHILRSLPIVAPVDLTLSDARWAAGRQAGHFVLKPYPFLPNRSLQMERMQRGSPTKTPHAHAHEKLSVHHDERSAELKARRAKYNNSLPGNPMSNALDNHNTPGLEMI